tara:strand:+ start:307 stop:681 length:375 start_codon:yes stop_codon:yes gene_type:complete
MGIFAKLFGSDEVIAKATTGLISGIDKVFYTDEEKSDNFSRMLRLYEPFKIAQRFLALIFSIPYASAVFITFLASFFIDVTVQIEILKGTIGYIVLTIVGFYFGGGAINGFVEKAMAGQQSKSK